MKNKLITQKLIDEIKEEVKEELSKDNMVVICNDKLGMRIELHSSEGVGNLIHHAQEIKSTFFEKENQIKSYTK